MKRISRFVLNLLGWKYIGGFPEEVPKCVLITAPHTSMWDFVYGRLALYALNIRANFIIKKEIFVPVLGAIIKAFGGIPIDRSRGKDIVEEVVKVFDENEKICLVITPEGTRKKVIKWKRGFYYIAERAQVPVAMGYIDYGTKVCEIKELIWPTGDFEKDFGHIEAFYRGRKGKHPEKFNLS